MCFIDHPEELVRERKAWAELPAFEKRRRLLVRQKEMLKLLLSTGALSRRQYDLDLLYLEQSMEETA